MPQNISRRDFLKLSGLAATSLVLSPFPTVAGPFTRADFDTLVPADKKLGPEWVKSLFARGARAVYRGPELDKIGMPIGGLCAGQALMRLKMRADNAVRREYPLWPHA